MGSIKKTEIWKKIQEFPENKDYIHQVRVDGSYLESINFLKKYSLENENFYIGNIPNEYIKNDYFNLDDIGWKSFIEESFLIPIQSEQDINFDNIGKYVFFKWVDLTKYWMNDGFYGIMGAHWNPRLKKVIIHPGGQRFMVCNLFPIRELKYIFWNTNGIYLPFMKNMIEVDVESLYSKYNHSPGGLTFDHGGIVPHPLHNTHYPYNQNIESPFKKTHKFLKENKLYFNLDIDILKEFRTEDKSKSSFVIEIKNKNKNLYKSVTKSLLLYINLIDYEDDDIKVYANR